MNHMTNVIWSSFLFCIYSISWSSFPFNSLPVLLLSLPYPLTSFILSPLRPALNDDMWHSSLSFHSRPAPLTLPTSCMSWSWRSCERVWWRSASCKGVSPSLSARFRLAPSRTSSCDMAKHVRDDGELVRVTTSWEISTLRIKFKDCCLSYCGPFSEVLRFLTTTTFRGDRNN